MEQVAREIDPSLWQNFDYFCRKKDYSCDDIEEKKRTSVALQNTLTKARAVVAIAVEECAKRADAWNEPSAIRLAAGEMTAQELRTAQAVTHGIAAAIRRLAEEGRG